MNSSQHSGPAASNVVPLTRVRAPVEFSSALQPMQHVVRYWTPHFEEHADFLVAIHLLDRTWGWLEQEVEIALGTILDGDWKSKGIRPLVSERTLQRSLHRLEAKGMIVRRRPARGRGRDTYSVNLDWTPEGQIDFPRLRNVRGSNRRLARGVNATGDGVIMTPEEVSQRHPIERNLREENYNNKNYSGSAPPRPVQSDNCFPGKEIGSASPRPVEQRRAAVPPNGPRAGSSLNRLVQACEATWRAAMMDTQDDIALVAWSVREKAQVKGKLTTWIAKDGSLPDLMDWAVRNWVAVVAKQFRWMTKSAPPKVPELSFFLSFMSGFIECRAEGKLDEWLSSSERTEKERLEAKGFSPEEAAASIGEQRAVEAMREENAKAKIEVRARIRRAEIIEKRTELTASLPMHPKSAAAMEIERAKLKPVKPMTDEELYSGKWLENTPTLDPNWEPPL